nr:hypothetical protein [Providencia stuartii]
MMEQPPDLLTPLSEIIGYSDNESQSPSKWYLACRIILKRSVHDDLLWVNWRCLFGDSQESNTGNWTTTTGWKWINVFSSSDFIWALE